MMLSTLTEGQAAPSEPEEDGADAKVIDIDSARLKVKKSFARTTLGIEKDTLFPRLSYSELKVGRVLGKGGFATVREILTITPKKEFCNQGSFSFRSWADITGASNGTAPSQDEEQYVPDFDPDFDESEFQSKKFIADYCTGRHGEARYVIKAISPEVKRDASKFLRAAMDMAIETQFLSVLDHPHIIRMRAVGNGDMFDKDYFLVLDRLYDTLDDRIEKWILELKRAKTFVGKLRGGKTKKKKLFIERLSVAKNLASAMGHLHGLK
uniref:Protein kinase domain-containing protein n=1 Tax=Odontella aurita TaxID=265563 RepID=A0A7S4K6K4_9STRA|mmetsp:Transcript_62776/g.185389  ORF Transcript_62776/g.185389 Transcript_62776/m.185389 type:complete len:267 (+) Transcript_62776:261-1061(+)